MKKMRHKSLEIQAKWFHHGKDVKDTNIGFNAKFLGAVEVSQPKGVEMVKESIKKLKISRQLKTADAGHKASKLVKVEIIISIDSIKVVELKNRNMICARPLQRVSYCADDHRDKRLFAFIAKEQDTKSHKCWVFVSEKEASEITLTLGQAFQLAYKRYLEKDKTEKKEPAKKAPEVKVIEKENLQLKEENERLKQELEANRVRAESISASDHTPSVNNEPVEPNIPRKSTISSTDFGFVSDTSQSLVDMNDISFIAAFDRSANDFDSLKTNSNSNPVNNNMLNMFTENDANKIDIFGTCDTPKDEDFVVKQDPFADTPDWSSAASMSSEELARTPSTPEKCINGTLHNGVVNRQSGNPFVNNVNNPDFNLNRSFGNQNSELFTQYLSNVVAQQSPDARLNNALSNSNESFFIEGNNGTFNSDNFNTDNQFSANNEFGFRSVNLTDAPGNTINEFDDTGNDFFGDNYVQRPKAHTISVLSADEKKFHNLPSPTSPNVSVDNSMLRSSDQNLFQDPAFHKGGLSIDDTFERPKALSVGASYNQVVRPRPTSLAVKSTALSAPPTKQAVKNSPVSAAPIKTPTQKMVTSTPTKEEQPSNGVVEDKRKPRSATSILPNVRNTAPVIETRARSRTRHAPLQPAAPMKESIFRASKSLEDLCALDSPTSPSTKSLSPKSTPGSRAPAPDWI